MLVKRFKGRIIKRMRRVSSGILLTFLTQRLGERGQQLIISQLAWTRHGTESYPRYKLAILNGTT